jgi:hypothetical protein
MSLMHGVNMKIISAQRVLREQKYFAESCVDILLQMNVSLYLM